MSGDLRAVLDGIDTLVTGGSSGVILAALAAADEPLTATVECHACIPGDLRDVCRTCNRTGTVRIVAMTEDVAERRLLDLLGPGLTEAVIGNLFGEAGDG